MNTDGHLHYVSDINVPPTRQSLLVVQHLFLVGWGGDWEYTRMLKLQKKGLNLISNVENITSWRVLFKTFNSQYNVCIYVYVCVCVCVYKGNAVLHKIKYR
jgi:hypothetical protein